MTDLNESSEISDEHMTESKKNQEFKIRRIKRDIERSCDNTEKHFWLFVVFFVAGSLLWHCMHATFSAGIDSWKTESWN